MNTSINKKAKKETIKCKTEKVWKRKVDGMKKK